MEPTVGVHGDGAAPELGYVDGARGLFEERQQAANSHRWFVNYRCILFGAGVSVSRGRFCFGLCWRQSCVVFSEVMSPQIWSVPDFCVYAMSGVKICRNIAHFEALKQLLLDLITFFTV